MWWIWTSLHWRNACFLISSVFLQLPLLPLSIGERFFLILMKTTRFGAHELWIETVSPKMMEGNKMVDLNFKS
jgi:hypothetical protein